MMRMRNDVLESGPIYSRATTARVPAVKRIRRFKPDFSNATSPSDSSNSIPSRVRWAAPSRTTQCSLVESCPSSVSPLGIVIVRSSLNGERGPRSVKEQSLEVPATTKPGAVGVGKPSSLLRGDPSVSLTLNEESAHLLCQSR